MVEWEEKIHALCSTNDLEEPIDHTSNCYFCMVPRVSKGISKKKKWILGYPNTPSALCPVPHDEELPIPEPPEVLLFEPDDEEDDRASDISALEFRRSRF